MQNAYLQKGKLQLENGLDPAKIRNSLDLITMHSRPFRPIKNSWKVLRKVVRKHPLSRQFFHRSL